MLGGTEIRSGRDLGAGVRAAVESCEGMESEKSRVKNFTGRAEEWHGWHQKFQAYLNGSGGDLLSVFFYY